MLVDTHTHIYHKRFGNDRSEMIQRAFDAGVRQLVLPAIDVKSIESALLLCERHEGIYAMSAIHPSDTKDAHDNDFDRVVEFCDHPKVVAVGESGLDYYWDRSFDDKQQRFFRMHIQLAMERGLPLVMHNREASEDLVRILKEEIAGSPGGAGLRGIFHCYGGPSFVGEAAVELGFLIGIGGTLTFKNSGVVDLVRDFPMSNIVLETDAPFLAPEPYRGKRNEPAYITYVAERLAQVKGTSVDEVARDTTANAQALFGISG